jgi:hypothetical protein
MTDANEFANALRRQQAVIANVLNDRINDSLQVMTQGMPRVEWAAPPAPISQPIADAGYFYAPFVPLLTTPPVIDPESFVPRRGILTRYGRRMLENGARFYGRVSIRNDSPVMLDDNSEINLDEFERQQENGCKVNWREEGF